MPPLSDDTPKRGRGDEGGIVATRMPSAQLSRHSSISERLLRFGGQLIVIMAGKAPEPTERAVAAQSEVRCLAAVTSPSLSTPRLTESPPTLALSARVRAWCTAPVGRRRHGQCARQRSAASGTPANRCPNRVSRRSGVARQVLADALRRKKKSIINRSGTPAATGMTRADCTTGFARTEKSMNGLAARTDPSREAALTTAR